MIHLKFESAIQQHYRLLLMLGIGLFLLLPNAANAQKDTATIGGFVTSIYDFDILDGSYKCEFWVWATYKNEALDFEDHIEVKYAKDITFEGVNTGFINGKYWYSALVKAELRKEWSTNDFPFDKQFFQIQIESDEFDSTMVVFVPDTANSNISDSMINSLKDWEISAVSFFTGQTSYPSNFGDPSTDGGSFYPSFNIGITLVRVRSKLILFKMITGLILAFMTAWIAFFMKPINSDPRFALTVSGLFAAVGNKYIIEGTVPPTNETTMLDQLHNITFLFILFTIAVSAIALAYYEKETPHDIRKSFRVNDISAFAMLPLFVITCLVIMWLYTKG